MLDKLSSKIGHSSDVLITNKDAEVKSHHDDTIPRQELVATTFAESADCLKRCVKLSLTRSAPHHPCVDIPSPFPYHPFIITAKSSMFGNQWLVSASSAPNMEDRGCAKGCS